MTLKDTIKGSKSIEKTNWEKQDIITYYLERPISYLFTWPLVNTPISANVVSFFSIVVSICALGFMSFGGNLLFKIIGWSLLFFWSILDCVDGNVARCKKTANNSGALWDAAAGYIAMSVLFISSTMIAFNETSLIEIPYLSKDIYLFIGFLSLASCLIPRIVMHKKKNSDNSADNEFVNRRNFSLIKIVINNIMSITGIALILLLIAIIFNFVNIYVLIYGSLNVLICIYSLIKLLK